MPKLTVEKIRFITEVLGIEANDPRVLELEAVTEEVNRLLEPLRAVDPGLARLCEQELERLESNLAKAQADDYFVRVASSIRNLNDLVGLMRDALDRAKSPAAGQADRQGGVHRAEEGNEEDEEHEEEVSPSVAKAVYETALFNLCKLRAEMSEHQWYGVHLMQTDSIACAQVGLYERALEELSGARELAIYLLATNRLSSLETDLIERGLAGVPGIAGQILLLRQTTLQVGLKCQALYTGALEPAASGAVFSEMREIAQRIDGTIANVDAYVGFMADHATATARHLKPLVDAGAAQDKIDAVNGILGSAGTLAGLFEFQRARAMLRRLAAPQKAREADPGEARDLFLAFQQIHPGAAAPGGTAPGGAAAPGAAAALGAAAMALGAAAVPADPDQAWVFLARSQIGELETGAGRKEIEGSIHTLQRMLADIEAFLSSDLPRARALFAPFEHLYSRAKAEAVGYAERAIG